MSIKTTDNGPLTTDKPLLIIIHLRSRLRVRGRLAPDVQVIEVERGVEEQEERALRLVSPHRIVGEQDDVPAPDWHINDGGPVRQLLSAREHAAYEQTLLIARKAEHDARALCRRHVERAELQALLIGQYLFAGTRGWALRRRASLRHRLHDVGVVQRTTPRRARPCAAARAFTATRLIDAHLKERRLIEVNGKRFAVAVSDWTAAIRKSRVIN